MIYNYLQADYLTDAKITQGRITEYHYCNYGYCGTYEYRVDGIMYEGHWSGDFFKCPDGTEGCLGKVFPVRYSIEKPTISEIDLGEFENKKSFKPKLWN